MDNRPEDEKTAGAATGKRRGTRRRQGAAAGLALLAVSALFCGKLGPEGSGAFRRVQPFLRPPVVLAAEAGSGASKPETGGKEEGNPYFFTFLLGGMLYCLVIYGIFSLAGDREEGRLAPVPAKRALAASKGGGKRGQDRAESPLAAGRRFLAEKKVNAWVAFFFTVYLILIIKFITIKEFSGDWFFGAYGLVVSAYILSRFLISYFYEGVPENGYEPVVTFVIPAKNEERAIGQTIEGIYGVDYPKEKIEVIAINDGSTDRTLEQMEQARVRHPDLVIVDWKKNKGKREGMAAGTRLARGEVLVFVDSDSFIRKDSIRFLAAYFADPQVAAVAGHAEVYNESTNMITKMQAVRYFISFRVYKATESIFHTVTCCSGCFSAYRKKCVDEVMDEWLAQRFLGVQCTYGDDRSLTNRLLENGYKLEYCQEAVAYTIVPDTWSQFFKQQLRWKKSWTRECFIASKFLWKRHPVMSVGFYISVILPLLAPIVVTRALVWYPYHTQNFPYFYLFGLILVSFLYGLYYYARTGKKLWFYGVVFAWFYTLVLIWQLPYAVLTLRDSKWGTR